MFLFKSETPLSKNKLTQHPWETTIKNIYSNKIKRAHNSVNNPVYPKERIKSPPKNPIRFTIIGDQVTKEFIHCVNLVKGLHIYKRKNFDVPVLRGVTTVDWPSVWNDLKNRFGGTAFCLASSVAVLVNETFLGGEKELEDLVETKYTYHLCLNYHKESIAEFAKFARNSGRPFAYMHIAINEEHIGTLLFMLYSDIVPFTCENFLRLCKETRGGYSGTPIHRIVRDGWIQCGGFGLKETHLDCENFIIPHDKRGVLCMANAGRHEDCSTQFFVLLQPAQWMTHKYVAFGQLVEGENTLKKIEEVPTWYESPTSVITIYKAGILNMECQDIMINRGANEYIHNHIEDLNALGELLYEKLLEKVFLTAELKEIEKQRELDGEEEHDIHEGAGVHETQRFKKEDIEKQLQKNKAQASSRRPTSASLHDNNDFDVEEYEYEYKPEEAYTHMSAPTTPSLMVKPEKPYYLPLTDVPYPGEVDSNFNLRRFLTGDYCLESDLKTDAPKKTVIQNKISFISEMYNDVGDSEQSSEQSLDSNDEKEIRKYLKRHADRVSFAGGKIKSIAKASAKFNIFEDARRSEMITDDHLRKLRLATSDYQARQHKKVSINAPALDDSQKKIKRRQTGFARPEDLEHIRMIHRASSATVSEDGDSNIGLERKVRIDPSSSTNQSRLRVQRRPTGFVRPSSVTESDHELRQSVLVRLYDEVQGDEDELPTLKDYRPMSELHPKNTLLRFSPNFRIRSDESNQYFRPSITVERESYDHLMSLQHSKKVAGKISSDYVKTIDQIEQRQENSLRSIEYAKTRPAITVSEYKMKNRKYQEELKNVKDSTGTGGIRLPGDSPLYSQVEVITEHIK